MSQCFSVSACVFLFAAVLLCHSHSSSCLITGPPASSPLLLLHSPISFFSVSPSALYSIYLSLVPLESSNPVAFPSLVRLPGDSAALSKSAGLFCLFLQENRITCEIALIFQLLLLDSSEIKWRVLLKSPASAAL